MAHEPGAFTRPRMTYGKRNTREERVELLLRPPIALLSVVAIGRAGMPRSRGRGGAKLAERDRDCGEHHQLDHRCRETSRQCYEFVAAPLARC
jgi:hypothetical protein